jgi:hypothetical protein
MPQSSGHDPVHARHWLFLLFRGTGPHERLVQDSGVFPLSGHARELDIGIGWAAVRWICVVALSSTDCG